VVTASSHVITVAAFDAIAGRVEWRPQADNGRMQLPADIDLILTGSREVWGDHGAVRMTDVSQAHAAADGLAPGPRGYLANGHAVAKDQFPHLGVAVKNAWGPAQIIEANFSTPFATIYLLVVSAAIFVCCLSILAATIRLCFGMARDNQLPLSRPLAKVAPSLHTPVWSCIVVALLSAVPFIKCSGAGIIAIAATGMIYLSYFLGNIAIMRARARGWPRRSAPFHLGRWGMLVNIVALLYGGAMLVNFAWPRVASNPSPTRRAGYSP
jgi:Amino acid permease